MEKQMFEELKTLVLAYCRAYPELRRSNESLSNFDFNQECGLKIKVPLTWQPQLVIAEIVRSFKSSLIIYHTAEEYQQLCNVVESLGSEYRATRSVGYLSWHKIYFSLYNKVRDSRPLQKTNNALNAEVVVIASAFNVDQEVLYHIQSFASGCLICLE